MSTERPKVVFLVKANNDVISHCKCESALIGAPDQMDCPWCGCGWLFLCSKCRRAFTFARAEEVDLTLEQLAHNDLDGKWGQQPTDEQIGDWIAFMKILTKDVRVGTTYAYIDGRVFAIDEVDIRFEGWHANHELSRVPQAAAIKDATVLNVTLGNKEYWDVRRTEDR